MNQRVKTEWGKERVTLSSSSLGGIGREKFICRAKVTKEIFGRVVFPGRKEKGDSAAKSRKEKKGC